MPIPSAWDIGKESEMGEVISSYDFLWRLVRRDIAAFFRGEREMCAANVGRAIGFGRMDQIEPIKACWAEAHKMKAAKQQQKEGVSNE
jgi:hypothetical protein